MRDTKIEITDEMREAVKHERAVKLADLGVEINAVIQEAEVTEAEAISLLESIKYFALRNK